MKPWIGCKYERIRLLIVGESHQLPNGITKLHYDENTWYDSRQEDVKNPVIDAEGTRAHGWMDTSFSVTDRRPRSNKMTYNKIENATGMSFQDFAFFNYIFRPVEHSERGYCRSRLFNIGSRDRAVSREIMEWFIRRHEPRMIVVASKCVIDWGEVGYLERLPSICTIYTHHPTASSGRFRTDVQKLLGLHAFGIRE